MRVFMLLAMLTTMAGCAGFRQFMDTMEKTDSKGFRDSTATLVGPCVSSSQCPVNFLCIKATPNAADGACYDRNSPEARKQ